jgi:hypothetical protein
VTGVQTCALPILRTLADSGTRFEFECYDTSHLYNLSHFLEHGLVKPPLFVQTVFGILGGIGSHAEDVLHMKRTADRAVRGAVQMVGAGGGPQSARYRRDGATFASGLRIRFGPVRANSRRATPSVARRRFIASNDHVNTERVEFDAAADAAGLAGGDECRSGAKKRVDDDVAAIREIQERVLEHGGRLDCRIVFEASSGVGAE